MLDKHILYVILLYLADKGNSVVNTTVEDVFD